MLCTLVPFLLCAFFLLQFPKMQSKDSMVHSKIFWSSDLPIFKALVDNWFLKLSWKVTLQTGFGASVWFISKLENKISNKKMPSSDVWLVKVWIAYLLHCLLSSVYCDLPLAQNTRPIIKMNLNLSFHEAHANKCVLFSSDEEDWPKCYNVTAPALNNMSLLLPIIPAGSPSTKKFIGNMLQLFPTSHYFSQLQDQNLKIFVSWGYW